MRGAFAGLGALLVLAVAAAGQDAVAPLFGEDAAAAERARRQLCSMPVAEVPVKALVALLRHHDVEVAARAASVLAHQGLAADRRHELLARSAPRLQELAFDLASTGELRALALRGAAGIAVPALQALEDRSELDDATLVGLLQRDDGAVVDATVALLLNERAPLPVALFDELAWPARVAVLRGLAERPRREATAWVGHQLEKAHEPVVRLHAIAALPPERIDRELGREVLRDAVQAEKADVAVAAMAAARRLSPALADRLVGYAHALVRNGGALDTALACLENVTEIGERQVLSLSGVLGPKKVEDVCAWLRARNAKGLDEQVQWALEGKVPLEPYMLRRAGKLLSSPASIQRVLALLDDADQDTARLAFYALIDAGLYRPAMRDFAQNAKGDTVLEAKMSRSQRFRALLQVPVGALPPELLFDLLRDTDPKVRREACRALCRSAYPVEIEERLLRMACGGGLARAVAGRAIASFGSRAAIGRLWHAAGGVGQRTDVIAWLVERHQPLARGLLSEWLGEVEGALRGDGGALAAGGPAELVTLRNELLWGLAMGGDATAGRRLLALARELPAALLRRCDGFAARLLDPQLLAVVRSCLVGARPAGERARELLAGWLGERPDLDTVALLRQVYEADPSDEVRQAALGALLRGPGAAPFHARLRAAMAKPLGSGERDLAYEVMAAAQPPVDQRELGTLSRLLLVAPLAEPATELATSAAGGDFPNGGDYPFHLPFVDVLRRDPEVAPDAFVEALAAMAAHPQAIAVSKRRLGHLLCQLVRIPHLRRRFAPPLAEHLLASLDRDTRFDGVARLVLAERAERAGDDAVAAGLYAAAARALLRHPLPPLVERGVLGDAGSLHGRVPTAALAARRWICAARAQRGRDPAAARAALQRASSLAYGDTGTEEEVHDLLEEMR